MKVFYSAIFRRDKEDPKWWNVSIPDVWGAVTCGDSFENAKYMAKDLLKTIYRLAPEQLGFPTTLEEIKKYFPEDIVEVVEVEIDDNPAFTALTKSNRENPITFDFDSKRYKFYGSLFDFRTSRIFLLNSDNSIKEEIMDNDQKYKLLKIARSIQWERMISNG